ncbi:signal transduction histidine kinase regulating citrate/malate metabolism [Haloferax mucosum ATCC BAA-1512]|uniref:histidine kinase n=1 Tax=Haloferax mucosum ATCC BAA-1512 TaxID=662479 RepID=M0IGD7_9EURY|nr:histidine kinase N-terminal 7TM domain-containing protein [Haloferax mucosum]ELZ95117.1 signal transduction histidine kinase regulating citrate/malate metabolism [Haloferax mucosum ATCC BAA-1512]
MSTTGLFVVAYFVSAGVELLLAGTALRYRDSAATWWFVVLTVLSGIWAFFTGVAVLGFSAETTTAATVAGLVVSTILPVVWARFVGEYLGLRLTQRPRAIAALSVVPVVTIGTILTNPLFQAAWTDASVVSRSGLAVTTFAFSPWIFVQFLYTNLVFLAGIVVIFRSVRDYEHIYERQAAAMLLGASIPLAAGFVSFTDAAPIADLDYIPMVLWLSGLCFAYALFESRFLDIDLSHRRIGEQKVIEGFEDGVVVVDKTGHVLSLNERAATLFDVERRAVFGTPIEEVVPDFPVDEDGHANYVGSDGRRYDVVRSTFEDRRGRHIGESFVFRDVTLREVQRQRLEVLNRVLRHNVRNEMNVVTGYADLIGDDAAASDDTHAFAARIREAATRLVSLGEKARTVETVFTEDEAVVTDVSVRTVAEETAQTILARHEHANVTVTVSPGIDIKTDRQVLKSVLDELVENAIVHYSDGDVPQVEIRAVIDDSADHEVLVVEVEDDGDGIPEMERRVVDSESEDELRHGSGVGLWLVQWGTMVLGGEVEFDDTDEGALVRLRIPRRSVAHTRGGVREEDMAGSNQEYF